MIPRIHRQGSNLRGLLGYLWGPGREEEHVNPRLVAVWEGGPLMGAVEPARAGGRNDFAVLVAQMTDPLRLLAGAPLAAPVWHCSLRLAPGDPVLSDDRWAQIARTFMDRVGLAPAGDEMAVPWVAMRHGDDHIHIAAVLVRQDGRRARTSHERLKARAAAIELEVAFGLTRTAVADRTAPRLATAAEQRKASRTGRAPDRDRLRTLVRQAAAAATGEQDFFDRLQTAGVQVKLRCSTQQPGQVTGYAVGLAGADRRPVWFSGGRLAPDLSLPRLRLRWQSIHAGAGEVSDVYLATSRAVRAAAQHLAASGARFPGSVGAVAAAAADLLTVVAVGLEGQAAGPATRASVLLDRAAREVMGRVAVRRTPIVGRVRQSARLVSMMGQLVDDRSLAMALQLMLDLAMLAETLAELREAQQRSHQAAAARLAAQQLRALGASAPAWPTRMSVPLTDVERHRMGRLLQALADSGAVTVEQVRQIADEPACGALWHVLRRAEQAGHDPVRVLAGAAAQRQLDTAGSIADVLHWRILRAHPDQAWASPPTVAAPDRGHVRPNRRPRPPVGARADHTRR